MLGLNGRSLPYERGFVLGGSSSVSASNSCLLLEIMSIFKFSDSMAYTRGSKDDFDRWADVTGDDQWSWNSLYPYMRKVRGLRTTL